ncbi:MAG: transcriptional regulator PpsR [Pseudomonadota bacterium]
MKNFAAPQESLGDLNTEAAARLIATAADIALVVDAEGTIRDLAIDRREFALADHETWLGRPWIDTVTVESRPKIEALMREALSSERTRWRQVNHPTDSGTDVPVLYSALRVGVEQRLVAFGRDLRTISSLQQRLIDAQQKLERDYTRLRHLETRYRLLFQLSDEPLLVIDAASDRVLEANPAAIKLLDDGGRGLVGRPFASAVRDRSSEEVQRLLSTVRATGRADEAEIQVGEEPAVWRAAVSLLRQENSWVFLVRLIPVAFASPLRADRGPDLQSVFTRQPDALVLTGADGAVISCNPAFLELIEIATEDQVRGDTLDRWLGRPGVDLNVLLSNLRDHGVVRLFATVLRGDYGSETEVEISACAAGEGERPVYAFTIRDVQRRFGSVAPQAGVVPQSPEQLTELVGRVSLKDLVRQTTEMIEKMYIEAALEMTGDNRASAAEMLGLSRQSLYVKLRRFGLRDLPEAAEPEIRKDR